MPTPTVGAMTIVFGGTVKRSSSAGANSLGATTFGGVVGRYGSASQLDERTRPARTTLQGNVNATRWTSRMQ